MKKTVYYIMPFVIVPCLMVLTELLDDLEILKMSPYIMGGVLLFVAAIVGFFSSTHRTFDYLMTVIMPLALFCTMFIAGFLDKSDMETRFHLYKAVNASFQPIALLLYFLIALITFLASFKKIRSIRSR